MLFFLLEISLAEHLLLTNQDYALVVGALALFAGLALVMYLTRGVDWGAFGRRIAEQAAPGR